MLTATVLTDEKPERWDRFVSSHELGSIYHTSLWTNVIERCYGHRVIRLVIEEPRHNIVAGLPVFIMKSRVVGNKMSTVPCAQCCDPLVTTQTQFDSLMEKIDRLIQEYRVDCYELKTDGKFAYHTGKTGSPLKNYSLYQLDLDRPLETIRNNFHKSCINRAINGSMRSGLQLRVAESERDVRDFYRLYVKMRKHHGLLPQPYRFFSCLWEIMADNGSIEVLHAEYAGRVISSLLLLKYKDTVVYEYGATDPAMTYLHPTHFLLWMAIQRAHSQGYKVFDFGRTSNENTGLSTFKSRWGAECKELSYYYLPNVKGVALLRQKSLAKLFMHQLVAHAPDALCAWMGRMAYKKLL